MMHRHIQRKEHQTVSDLKSLVGDGLLRLSEGGFEHDRINLLTAELDHGEVVYKTFFNIGAEWLDADHTCSLVVTPKIDNIDFLTMFVKCLGSPACAATFHDIYDIDFEQPEISAEGLDSVLTPLLLAQFLTVTGRIAYKGLKRGYITKEDNLKKIKGRLLALQNERKNLLNGRRDRFMCRYDEYSYDTPENRLIKKALIFAQSMLHTVEAHNCHEQLNTLLRKSLSAFEMVSDQIELNEITFTSHNKLYADYGQAITLAKMILRRYDFNISNVHERFDTVPVFRIDMSLLFEHYVYALLDEAYGTAIQYQVSGSYGRYIADFLYSGPGFKAIVDTKYIEFDGHHISGEIIAQLSGYARDYRLLNMLGLSTEDETAIPVLPCIILYPTYNAEVPEL